jgi:hypothetical protein
MLMLFVAAFDAAAQQRRTEAKKDPDLWRSSLTAGGL